MTTTVCGRFQFSGVKTSNPVETVPSLRSLEATRVRRQTARGHVQLDQHRQALGQIARQERDEPVVAAPQLVRTGRPGIDGIDRLVEGDFDLVDGPAGARLLVDRGRFGADHDRGRRVERRSLELMSPQIDEPRGESEAQRGRAAEVAGAGVGRHEAVPPVPPRNADGGLQARVARRSEG